MMSYSVMRFVHLLGLMLMGAGLIGVWYGDLRARQVRGLALFAEAIRQVGVFYDGLVVPGALLLLGSGIWLIVSIYEGWAFVRIPWLVGMVALFAFEFIEGNTITRLYFLRLRRLTRIALEQGSPTPELVRARREQVPTFTHFLDLPILFVIVALGTMRPNSWSLFWAGTVLAVIAAAVLTLVIPRLIVQYSPWSSPSSCEQTYTISHQLSTVFPTIGYLPLAIGSCLELWHHATLPVRLVGSLSPSTPYSHAQSHGLPHVTSLSFPTLACRLQSAVMAYRLRDWPQGPMERGTM